jgi:cyclopropane-fatty-acyl-phospholipid synthase
MMTSAPAKETNSSGTGDEPAVVAPAPRTDSPPEHGEARLVYEALKNIETPCEFTFHNGETLRCGPGGDPLFRVSFQTEGVLARGLNEYAIGRAYIDGDIEIEGDMRALFEVRRYLQGISSKSFLIGMWLRIFLRNPIKLNREVISRHYDLGDDFYLAFIDRKHRLYSHCLFHTEDESLEEAAEHKFETLTRALRLEPGMRLLDIGAGWGAVTSYAGPRGIKVTGLTIAEDSRQLHEELIARENLTDCTIRMEDFLEHVPAEPYDAIVIFGVIEHIPQYRRFVEQVWKCLKPGGRIYLDASAVVEKYKVSDFVREYIYPGTHSYLVLPDLVQEFLLRGFKVNEVVDETHEYDLTLHHWARRFEANRDHIVKRWGEGVFRSFRMYLWGGSYAMHTRTLQAYHVVAERTEDPGIRPGVIRRFRYFLRSLT